LDGAGNTIYKLENDNLHARARIEWGINFIGLTDTSKVRVYIDHFYETIPHESHIDNFFPQKSPQGNTDVSTKIMHKISTEAAVTNRAEVNGSSMMNILSKIWDYAKPHIGTVAGSIVSAAGNPLVGGMIASGYNLLSGRMNNSDSQ
jgi:hypothetical protein